MALKNRCTVSAAKNIRPAPRELVDAAQSINRHVFDGKANVGQIEIADIPGAYAHCEPDGRRYAIRMDREHFFSNEGGRLTAHVLIMIAHELGHAVAGSGHGHGPVWQQIMKAVGIRTTGRGDDAAIPGGRFDVWRQQHYPGLSDGFIPDLNGIPGRIKELGQRIAAGGGSRDAALEELAGISRRFGVAEDHVAAALAQAKSGRGVLRDDDPGPKGGGVPPNAGRDRPAALSDRDHSARRNTQKTDHLIVVDASESMHSNMQALASHVRIATATGGMFKLIGFRGRPVLVSSVDELISMCPGTGTCQNPGHNPGNDIAAALRMASSMKPSSMTVITDAGDGIFNVSWGPAHREIDRIHAAGCRDISAVWLQMPEGVAAAETGSDVASCDGPPWSGADYMAKGERFMTQLVRGNGRLHIGRPASNIYNENRAEIIGKAVDSAANEQAAPVRETGHEVAIFKRGDAAVMSGDTGRGTREMLQDVVKHVQETQRQAAARYGEKSEEYQRQSQRAVKASMDGLERRAALFISERERQQLEHHWDLLNQELDSLAEMGERMDEQAIHTLRQHKEHYDAVQGRSAEVFRSGRKALHESFQQEITSREIEGSWTAPAEYASKQIQRRREVRPDLPLHDMRLSLPPITGREAASRMLPRGERQRQLPPPVGAMGAAASTYLTVASPRGAANGGMRRLPPRRG
jgi:hypothetical protein